jgi:hypothetical protein
MEGEGVRGPRGGGGLRRCDKGWGRLGRVGKGWGGDTEAWGGLGRGEVGRGGWEDGREGWRARPPIRPLGPGSRGHAGATPCLVPTCGA